MKLLIMIALLISLSSIANAFVISVPVAIYVAGSALITATATSTTVVVASQATVFAARQAAIYTARQVAVKVAKRAVVKATRRSTFRKRALAQTKTNSKGQYRDAYTGKYHKAKDMDADHIFPHSKGGSNSSWNSAMTHKSINRSKGAKIQPARMLNGYSNNPQVRKGAVGIATATITTAAVTQ